MQDIRTSIVRTKSPYRARSENVPLIFLHTQTPIREQVGQRKKEKEQFKRHTDWKNLLIFFAGQSILTFSRSMSSAIPYTTGRKVVPSSMASPPWKRETNLRQQEARQSEKNTQAIKTMMRWSGEANAGPLTIVSLFGVSAKHEIEDGSMTVSQNVTTGSATCTTDRTFALRSLSRRGPFGAYLDLDFTVHLSQVMKYAVHVQLAGASKQTDRRGAKMGRTKYETGGVLCRW